VRGAPEVLGEFPAAALAEEIATPGPGRVRALLTIAGNPARSAPNSAELERALAGLDFMFSVDPYLNETTRHAHVILPTPSPAELPGYELGLYLLSVRNVAKWSWPVVPAPPGCPETWQVLSGLAARLMGMGDVPAKAVDDLIFRRIAEGALAEGCPWPGLTVDEATAKLEGAIGPERIVDLLLRIGPHGDGFGRRADGLTLARVQASPHGIDLGPLEPRLEEVVNTQSGLIELAPPAMTDDVARLRERMAKPTPGMLLIGRRDLRCSNSFMHNLPALVKGRDRCTLQVSRQDAGRIGLSDGASARVTSRVGSLVAPIEVSDDLMPGVVSLPHGWGHDAPEARLTVAKAHAGVNANILTDDRAYDVASGTAVLFGTPVTVERASAEGARSEPQASGAHRASAEGARSEPQASGAHRASAEGARSEPQASQAP
jgi:anaerobic selenocysteine-containing dehydrogenase